LFNISSETGIINFTVPTGANTYYILITAEDNSTCDNNNNTQTLVLIANVAPSITSYYPLTDPTITEEQTQLFNVTYEDGNEDILTVYWYLDNSLVSTFNDISNILKSNYSFTGNYANAGIYNVSVVVSDSLLNDSYNWTLTVTNVNRPPYFIKTIKNQTWAEDSILYGLDLDDYSYDPDPGDTLSYSVNYLTDPHAITITINSENVVTFTPTGDWYGSENISFTVTDNYGAGNTSNNVTLTVYEVPEPEPTIISRISTAPGRVPACIEFWLCTFWSLCYQDGFMKRTCEDLSECGREYYKPLEVQNCIYIPSCFNRVQDGEETDVDCGGPCGPCPSCFDGTMNNDETGIDCGGACRACPTCFDGMLNGGEIGIDCGGACELQDCCKNGYRDAHLGERGIDCDGNCKECEVEIERPAPRRLYWIIIAITVILIVIAILIYIKREKVKLLLPLITKKFRKKEIAPPRKIRNVFLSKINGLERESESMPIEGAFKEFSMELRNILMTIFRIKYEFTYESIISVIEESKLNIGIKSIFIEYIKRIIHISYSGYKISKEELILLAKELRIMIYLITKSVEEEGEVTKGGYIKEKEEYETELEKFFVIISKLLFMLENEKIEKARELCIYSKEIYNRLSPEEKKEADNYIKRIVKEIKLFEKKIERRRRTKDMTAVTTALIILLFLGSMDIFFGTNITGLSVFEEENIQSNAQFLISIKGFNIEAGEHFVYRIKGYDKEEETLYFSDDTKLFNINADGIIDFIPTEDSIGIHHVTIIIKDANYKTSFKDVVFNITKFGGIESIIETVSEVDEIKEEIEVIEEVNKTPEENETEEEINISKEVNETLKINKTLNISSDIKQDINQSKNITQQLSEDFLLRLLDIYVGGFELGNNVEFNVLVENSGNREIKNAYLKISVEDNNSLIEIQSTPITIASKERKEMISQWNAENITIGNYTGKLIIMYENKRAENDIRISAAEDGIETEIISVTGMVTAPSSIVEIQSYTDVTALLILMIIIIVSIDAAWFLIYSGNRKIK